MVNSDNKSFYSQFKVTPRIQCSEYYQIYAGEPTIRQSYVIYLHQYNINKHASGLRIGQSNENHIISCRLVALRYMRKSWNLDPDRYAAPFWSIEVCGKDPRTKHIFSTRSELRQFVKIPLQTPTMPLAPLADPWQKVDVKAEPDVSVTSLVCPGCGGRYGYAPGLPTVSIIDLSVTRLCLGPCSSVAG